jgi:hypothetical protein
MEYFISFFYNLDDIWTGIRKYRCPPVFFLKAIKKPWCPVPVIRACGRYRREVGRKREGGKRHCQDEFSRDGHRMGNNSSVP